MADSLFEFQEPLAKEDVTQAVYDVELKNWTKARDAAAKDENPFDIPQPTQEAIEQRFEGQSAEAALMSYATNGRLNALPETDQVLTADEAKNFGAALLQVEKNNEAADQLHPEVTVKGSDGKDYQLEPKELSAWLQANAKVGQNIPANDWATAEENKVGLTSHGDTIQNGNEQLYIETRDGERRVVGNGNLTEKMEGYYGAIKDEKLRVADGDYLDVYISQNAYNGMQISTGENGAMQAGKPYDGPVFVMQSREEMKLGFAANVDEFKESMLSTWTEKQIKDGEFEKKYEGQYVELTQEEYKKLKAAIAEENNLPPAERNFGMDHFLEKIGVDKKKAERTPKTGVELRKLGQAEEPNKGQIEVASIDTQVTEKPLSSLPVDVLAAAVAAVGKGVTQFHIAAHDADYGNNKVASVPNEKGGQTQERFA